MHTVAHGLPRRKPWRARAEERVIQPFSTGTTSAFARRRSTGMAVLVRAPLSSITMYGGVTPARAASAT